jgi:hypothetical protein
MRTVEDLMADPFVKVVWADFWAHEDGDGPYEYMDNFRVARKSNAEEVAAFEEQDRRGCCGSVNFERTDPQTGETWLFGFNHGH